MQDNLNKMSNPIFEEKYKQNVSKCLLLKFLPSMQIVKAKHAG